MNDQKLSVGESDLDLTKKLPVTRLEVVESVTDYEHMKMMTVTDYMRFFNKPHVSVYFHSQGNYILANDRPEKLPQYSNHPTNQYDTTKGVIFYTRYGIPSIEEQRFVSLTETCLVNTGVTFRKE